MSGSSVFAFSGPLLSSSLLLETHSTLSNIHASLIRRCPALLKTGYFTYSFFTVVVSHSQLVLISAFLFTWAHTSSLTLSRLSISSHIPISILLVNHAPSSHLSSPHSHDAFHHRFRAHGSSSSSSQLGFSTCNAQYSRSRTASFSICA